MRHIEFNPPMNSHHGRQRRQKNQTIPTPRRTAGAPGTTINSLKVAPPRLQEKSKKKAPKPFDCCMSPRAVVVCVFFFNKIGTLEDSEDHGSPH